MQKQSLVKGALILTAASFVTKILVFGNSIVLSRVLGPEGIGLAKMVMPFMGLMLTLTTIGLPVAISKLVAETMVQRNRAKVKKILLVSLAITGSLSIVVVCLSVIGGKLFSSNFLSDPRSYYSFMALVPIVPIGAVSSVLKGYFRGMQNMNPIALSQVIEKIVQVGLTYVLVLRLMPLGIEYAAAGAVLSSVIGEACSLLIFILMFKNAHRRKFLIPHPNWTQVSRGKSVLFELLQTGLPTTGNGFVISLSRALQPVVISKSLAAAGVSSVLIARQYGMLTGYVMPLLFLPGFINQSLGITLVPAISEANIRDNFRLVHHRLNQAIRAALIVGTPSTVFMYLFAPELMTVIYRAPAAAPLLRLIAPFFILNYLQTPLQSTLVGIGQAKTAMFNNFIAKCLTVTLIYPLAANLKLGINGVILAISMGVIVETVLHFTSVSRAIGFYLEIPHILKIISAGLVMGLCGRTIFMHMAKTGLRVGNPLMITASLLISLLIYIILLGHLKVLDRHEISRIPGIGKMLSLLFPL